MPTADNRKKVIMNGSYIPFVYRWAVTQATPLGKMPLAVLVTLISYMDMKDKICFPSRRLIASQIYGVPPDKVTRSQLDHVREGLNILVANELILKDQDLRINGSKSTNNYEILVPNFEDVGHPSDSGGTTPQVQGGATPPNQRASAPPVQGGGDPENGGDHKYPSKAPGGSVQKKGSTESTSPEGRGSSEDRERVWQMVADRYWKYADENKNDPDRMSIPEYIDHYIEKGY